MSGMLVSATPESWFLDSRISMYGSGGAMTRYAEYVEGCGSTYGEKIIPITEDEAKEWVEKYLTVDEYIKIFGECEE